MKFLGLLISVLLIAGCSMGSKKPLTNETSAKVKKEATTSSAEKPAATKPPAKSCKYDTDCIIQNACMSGKCKFGGEECRFRSDCRTSGQCVSGQCAYQ